MDLSDRFPEERLGAPTMMRKRADELEAVATACDAEARDQEQAAARLRARAEALRAQVILYRGAATVVERGPA